MITSLVLFEDNTELRKSLVNLLNSSKQFIVSGDFSNVMDVRNIIRTHLPDVIILDINMPGPSGIDAIEIIKEENPDSSVIMYTQFEEQEKLFKSICAGADGYILKKTSPHKLIEAIKEVSEGGAPLSPSIAKKMLASFRTKQKPAGTHFNLTIKETEILELLVKGYSVKLIASEMKTSYNTTRTHLRNMYRKLHVNCGKEAIAKVLTEKII